MKKREKIVFTIIIIIGIHAMISIAKELPIIICQIIKHFS